MTIRSVDELNALTSIVESLIVKNYGCNDASFTVLNLTRFANLKEFEVGDECFRYVNEVHLIGLSKLARVVIGRSSSGGSWVSYPDRNRHFYLKDCPQLRELKIGRYTFSGYTVIEIENVPSLEVIEMGELNEYSYNFFYASLELKSEIDGME